MAMMRWAVAVLTLACSLALAAPTLNIVMWRLIGGSKDTTVGTISRVGHDVLETRFRGKSALVVGATRGIGRGIAVALAKSGASVQVVGRSGKGGAAVVESMAAVALSGSQRFRAHSHDLSSVRGCQRLVSDLLEQDVRFDFLVFTVGMWPDVSDPNTADGVNKVFALDVLARFAVFAGVQPLLSSGARVMSVLASTTKMHIPPAETLRDIIRGASPPGLGGFGMLPVAAVSADALLQQAAARHPELRFVGTQPGIVSTDVIRTTFPAWLADLLQVLMGLVAQSEEECGDVHLNILSSPNLERRQVSYVDFLLEAREAMALAYDQEFGSWLWSFLETLVEKHK